MNKTKDNSVKSDNNQSNKQTVNKLAKKSYNEEFKAQVIEVYNSGIYATVEECAKGYNVPTNTLPKVIMYRLTLCILGYINPNNLQNHYLLIQN